MFLLVCYLHCLRSSSSYQSNHLLQLASRLFCHILIINYPHPSVSECVFVFLYLCLFVGFVCGCILNMCMGVLWIQYISKYLYTHAYVCVCVFCVRWCVVSTGMARWAPQQDIRGAVFQPGLADGAFPTSSCPSRGTTESCVTCDPRLLPVELLIADAILFPPAEATALPEFILYFLILEDLIMSAV